MDCATNAPTVLVTGATGFVGANLAQALTGKGFRVACLVRAASDMRALQNLPIQRIIGDLQDPAAIRSLGKTIHAVYHVAGAIKAATRHQFFEINQRGTRRLAETIAETGSRLQRFVHISSLAAAGPSRSNSGRTEEEPSHPISWYGESKLAAEAEIARFAGAFPVTILRPSAVYGPRDREILLIFRMIRRGCMITPGRHLRRFSLIHVEDLVDAIIRASEVDHPTGEIFNISRPESYLWEDVGRAIARELGTRFRRIALPAWMARTAGVMGDGWSHLTGRAATLSSQKVRELLEPSWLCDTSKARKVLGFNPVIDLESGIRATAQWYQHHGWL